MWHASRAALAITHWVLYPLQKPCILPADMYTQLAHLDLGTGSLIIQVIVDEQYRRLTGCLTFYALRVTTPGLVRVLPVR